jgi:hypothetical protein
MYYQVIIFDENGLFLTNYEKVIKLPISEKTGFFWLFFNFINPRSWHVYPECSTWPILPFLVLSSYLYHKMPFFLKIGVFRHFDVFLPILTMF